MIFHFKLFLNGEEWNLDVCARMAFSGQESLVYYDEMKARGNSLFIDTSNPIHSV